MSLQNCPNFVLNLSERNVNGEKKHFYQFKSFRLDVEERQLLHEDSPVPLTPKAFNVLALLVERGGHLIERDELLKLVWADSFVEEQNITRIIHLLRKTLGEDENGNKFIETVAKKGYRFVAEVNEISEPTVPNSTNGKQNSANFVETPTIGESQIPTLKADEIVAPPAVMPKRNPRIILFAVGSLSAVFLILLLSFNFRSGSSDSPNEVKSIAVLPVKPINAASRDEIYEIGIAETLIFRLSSSKELLVRPLNATRQYTDLKQDPLVAGHEQQVDYVLASNYQIADGKIRLTAQLFNVASGQIEETYKSEKGAADLFGMQDAIAVEIGNLLLARFAATSNLPAAKRGTTNEEAYRLYRQGRDWTVKGGLADAQKGIGYFEQAIRLDPDFARAYSAMAYAYIRSGHLGGGLPREEYEKARVAVTKALELDNNLAEGYRILGELKHVYEWDSAGAEKAWRRAFELEPNSESRYAGYLAECGRFDESIAAIDRMIEGDPNSLQLRRERGRILYLARRYDEAIIQLKRVLELDENLDIAWAFLQQAYHMKGDDAAAYESFMKYQKPVNSADIELYQKAYKTAGWRGVAQKHLELLKLKENKPSGNYYRIARFSAMLGEKEQAFEYLNKAIEKRHGQLRMLKVEPNFDILRDDPRFDELVKRVGL